MLITLIEVPQFSRTGFNKVTGVRAAHGPYISGVSAQVNLAFEHGANLCDITILCEQELFAEGAAAVDGPAWALHSVHCRVVFLSVLVTRDQL